MKNSLNEKALFNVIITVLVFIIYKFLPTGIQVFVPFLLGVYSLINIGYLIYKRSFWEDILKELALYIAMVVLFITYFKSAYRFDDSFMKVCLLTVGWMFPVLAISGVVSWRRKGENDKYKKGIGLLVYCIILAIFCTGVVIIK